MSQQKLQSNNDLDVLFEIENLIDSLSLSTQKSISMAKLNVAVKEAFAEPVELLEKIGKLFKEISDETVQIVTLNKIILAINDFESRISKI